MSNQKKLDPLVSLKFKGYVRSQTPPGGDMALEDFVRVAKFYLCQHAHRLWLDPIWETYTDEEILIEYFAHLYSKDEQLRRSFEATLEIPGSDDVYDWLDRKMEELKEEQRQLVEDHPDTITFSPDSGVDVEE